MKIVLICALILVLTSFFGKQADAQRLDRAESPDDGDSPSLQKPPQAKDDAERRILDCLYDMHENQRGGMMNISPEDGRLLRMLTETNGAKNVVEIGTSNGYSTIWLCLALRKTGGKLTTFEIDAERASLARENLKRAGVEDLVTLIEGDAHRNVRDLKEPIDVLFLDADKPGYVSYLERLLPLIKPGGLVIAHNMRRPPPDPRYIEAVTANPALDTSFLLMESAGVGVTIKKR